MPDPCNLTDKVAVVTGATRGIGAAIAEKLAAHGAHLVLNGARDGAALDAACAKLADAYGVRTVPVVGDVADAATADALAKAAFSNFKRVDVWVNNAGILHEALLGMAAPAEMERAVAVNLNSVLHGTQAAVRVMRRASSGSIVNLSSIMGRFGNRGLTAYAASKAGVIGATMAAAKEVAPLGIRVNAIAPGFIDSDMTAGMAPDKYQEKIDAIGMKRAGTGEEVADAVLFFASDLSRYVTGQVLGVDGSMIV